MIVLAILCGAGAAYQILALLAVVHHLRKRPAAPSSLPPVSILKPVVRTDEALRRALASHERIDYPDFEVLCGYEGNNAPNRKAGRLEMLLPKARTNVLVVSDADIQVPPEYLRCVVGDLQRPGVGLVTCLYRADGGTFPARFEALGISTDFAPSALVAAFVGIREFGLGSTLALTRATLHRIGGFEAVRNYLADDYRIGKQVSQQGLQVYISRVPVATWLGSASWGQVWRHQVRWARTIRFSRGAYFGLPISNGTLWALVAALSGSWPAFAALLALRLTTGLVCGMAVLKDPLTRRLWWLMPIRDLWGFCVFVAGAFGTTVEWQGRRLRVDKLGRIIERQNT